ncbi:MAG TPA: hypothetical protein PKD86_10010 [Gemmatales bacterium]|nr:hypothetical protein [Gemmatales bacterium]
MQQVRYQPVPLPLTAQDAFDRDYQIQLEPPSRERLYRVEAEDALFERVRQEFRQRNDRAEFPKEVKGVKLDTVRSDRTNPPMATHYVAPFVCYHPLWFEDKNTERYGWELGVLQPLASTAHFWANMALLPYHAVAEKPWTCEANTGYFRPGDPVPYYLYTPRFSWPAVAAQAGTLVGASAIFP